MPCSMATPLSPIIERRLVRAVRLDLDSSDDYVHRSLLPVCTQVAWQLVILYDVWRLNNGSLRERRLACEDGPEPLPKETPDRIRASSLPSMVAGRIRHTVAFTLGHPEGSTAERDFLKAAARLATIPGVEAFELLDEVSPKNGYRFAISMEFADRRAYGATTSIPITFASFRSVGSPR